ncbi:hypothetical protein F0562_030121 [Nyssa sinensis]|uniref:Chromo domain-containing protein n=1 Tax=Nyssa sinensis TaxID=561372 RepID=A0A5J5AXV4_9ASTE|nr:hypothetical protein F0562_030121 [Nyssa sinensis]
MQQERPIAFMSQAIHGKASHLSTYEKELMALVLAIKKWRYYVLGQTFCVQTDHQSLKYLLEQKVGTPMQQKWLTKLLGFDFLVEYKKGKDNLVTDALSRKFEDAPATLAALSFPSAHWLSDLRVSYSEDPKLQKLISEFAGRDLDVTKYSMKDGLLFYKGRLYISNSTAIKNQLLHLLHGSPQAGHSGFHKTLSLSRANYYWKGMKANLKKFIRECDVCQRNKTETIHPAGLLQPLPILTRRKLGARNVLVTTIPPVAVGGGPQAEPEEILQRRLRKKKGRAVSELLVKWKGLGFEEASWVDFRKLQKDFPDLEGKVF